MRATLGAIAFNAGGVVAGAVVLGGVVDVVVASHMFNQAQISGDTPISGLTIGGLVIAGGFAVSAIYKGGTALFELGGELEKWKLLINDAATVARAVSRLGDQLADTSEQVRSNTEAIRSLEEWRATMDPTVFRQTRNPPNDKAG